jgi:hypothetical protein
MYIYVYINIYSASFLYYKMQSEITQLFYIKNLLDLNSREP